MVTHEERSLRLRRALEAQDPKGVADALKLPPVSIIKTTDKPISHQSQDLTIDDTDFPLKTLLDLCAAAETVRRDFICFVWV